MWEECNEHVEKINGILGKLGGLKKQFSRDQLNTCQNYHEALKIQSDMNAVSIEALRMIRCMVIYIIYSKPDVTSDEEQEDETSGSGSWTIDGTINASSDSGKCAHPTLDLEVLQPCRPRPPEDDKGGDDDFPPPACNIS